VTDAQLQELEGAHAATTPGWERGRFPFRVRQTGSSLVVADFRDSEDVGGQANRDFAVAIHAALPALLERLRKAEALNAAIVNDRLSDSDALELARRLERGRAAELLEEIAAEEEGSGEGISPFTLMTRKAAHDATAAVLRRAALALKETP
jgi:hypothetical protein